MSQKVALICHLQRIEPLCEPASMTAPFDWYFTLNLATSLEEPLSTADALIKRYLTPWRWQTFPSNVAIQVETPADPGPAVVVGIVTGTIIPNPIATPTAGPLTKLQATLDTLVGSPFPGDRDPCWRPGDPDKPTLLAHTHARLATLPFPISQWLNLSLCFKVTLSPGSANPVSAALCNNDPLLFFAVPSVAIDTTETQSPTTLGTVLPPADIGSRSTPQARKWPLAAGTSTPGDVTAYLEAATVNIPTDPRLDVLKTQWAQNSSAADIGWGGERWQSTLVPRVASAFDLGQRLIDFARKNLASFIPSLNGLAAATIALLRDTADAGLRPLTSGRSLLDEALAASSADIEPSTIPVPSSEPLKTQTIKAHTDGLQRSFRAAVQLYDRKLALYSPPRETEAVDWRQSLVQSVPRINDLLSTLIPNSPATIGNEAVDQLDRLQSIVVRDDVVAQLIQDTWSAATLEGAGGNPPRLPIPLADYRSETITTLPSDVDHPGTSNFILSGTQIIASPGSGHATMALQLTGLSFSNAARYRLSIRMRCSVTAPNDFLAGAAYRVGNFPASDYAANPDLWTTFKQFDKTSQDCDGMQRIYDVHFPSPTAPLPATSPLALPVTVVLYFDPKTSTGLNVAWENLEFLPCQDFFTAYQLDGSESGTLALFNGNNWSITLPDIDQSQLGPGTLYRISLAPGADADPPLITLVVEKVSVTSGTGTTDNIALSWLRNGVPTLITNALLWSEFNQHLTLRLTLQASTRKLTAGLQYFDSSSSTWTSTAATVDIPVTSPPPLARLRVIACQAAAVPPAPPAPSLLTLLLPEALDAVRDVNLDDLATKEWRSNTLQNKPRAYWQAAQFPPPRSIQVDPLTDILRRGSPSRQLREALAAVALHEFTFSSDDPQQQILDLKGQLHSELAKYIDTRLSTGTVPASEWGFFWPICDPTWLSQAQIDAFKAFVQQYADELVDSKLSEEFVPQGAPPLVANDGLPAATLTQRPHPIVIPFDMHGTLASSTDQDNVDLHRFMSGVGLFLGVNATTAAATNIRCTNLAKITLETWDSTISEFVEDPAPLVNCALIPYRATYTNQQRSAAISYDNSPLMINARNSAGSIFAPVEGPGANGDGTVASPSFRFNFKPIDYNPTTDIPLAGDIEFARPPMLKFGGTYALGVSLVTPGGGLAPELLPSTSSPGFHPARLRRFTPGDFLPSTAKVDVLYLRHVPLSSPRGFNQDTADNVTSNAIGWPSIPDRTKPLARDLNRERLFSARTATGADRVVWYRFTSPQGNSLLVWTANGSGGFDWTIEILDASFTALDDGTEMAMIATTEAPTPSTVPAPLFNLKIKHSRTASNAQVATFLVLTDPSNPATTATVDLHQSTSYDLKFDFSTPGQVAVQARERAYADYSGNLALLPIAGLNGKSLYLGLSLPQSATGTLAFSLPLVGRSTAGDVDVSATPLQTAGPSADFAGRLPLALLTPGGDFAWDGIDSLELHFGKPSAEFEVWWRWYQLLSNPAQEKIDRTDVLAEIIRRRDTSASLPSSQPGDSLSDWVDDPSVADFLVLEAVPLRAGKYGQIKSTSTYLVEAKLPSPFTRPLNLIRSGSIQLNCVFQHLITDPSQFAQAEAISYDSARKTYNFQIRSGEVWELRVYSCVETILIDGNASALSVVYPRIATGVNPDPRRFTASDGKTYYLMNPSRFLVEGAADVAVCNTLLIAPNGRDETVIGWLEDISIPSSNVTVLTKLSDASLVPAYFLQFDLVVVCSADSLPATDVAAYRAKLATLLQAAAVPMVVLGANEAVALGLASATNPSAARTAQVHDVPAPHAAEAAPEFNALRGGYLPQDPPALPWTSAAVSGAPASATVAISDSASSSELLVFAVEKNAPLALPSTSTASDRRVTCLVPDNPDRDLDMELIRERLFKGAVRYAARCPLAEQLWRALQPQWTGSDVAISLARSCSSRFDFIGSVEVRHQSWRWAGSPVTRFPFELSSFDLINRVDDPSLAEPDIAYAPLLWDAEGFARRGEDSHTSVDPTLPARPLDFGPIDRQPLADDERSHYYRYSLVATSRYAGLAPVATIVSAQFPDPDVVNLEEVDSWRRVFVPCRKTGEIPKPALKLVLPLTQAADDEIPGASPGLLAIFSDDWFQFAGLAETIRAHVELVNYKGPSPDVYAEFGPDPILSKDGVAVGSSTTATTPAFTMSGPVGTTFDGNASEALYAKSWFIVEPLSTSSSLTPFDWTFAKLHFRRGLCADAILSPDTSPPGVGTSAFDVSVTLDMGNTDPYSATTKLFRASSAATPILGLQLTITSDRVANLRKLTFDVVDLSSGTVLSQGKLPLPPLGTILVELKFEFRSLVVAGKNEPIPRWLVQAFARKVGAAWRSLRPVAWSDDALGAALVPQLTVTGSPTTVKPMRYASVPESDPTDAVWVQILPNSSVVPVELSSGTATTVPASYLLVNRMRDASGAWIMLQLTATDSSLGPLRLAQELTVGSQSCFLRAVALTAVISDFRGQATERFIGIYAQDSGDPSLLHYVPIDKDYKVEPNLDPQGKAIPGSSVSVNTRVDEPISVRSLRGRIITMQWHAKEIGASITPPLNQDVTALWKELFQSTHDFGKGLDERGRIISVSPPFGESTAP